MDDKNLGQSTANTGGLRRRSRVPRWRRWHHKSRILLMLLGAVALTIYVLRAGLAKEYAGIGAALCAIAVGAFLVWHLVHVLAEEDVIEEREINKPSDGNPTNSTKPSP